jgi:hypothetical protein
MARTYARVKTAIWADDEFRLLSMPAQHLYFVLLTSNGLNYCGVTDWRPKRIAAGAGGWNVDEVRDAAVELADRLYVAVDEDTEEILLRSFIRNDGFMEQTTVAAAMVRAYGSVASKGLRGIVVHELLRLKSESPEMKGWKYADPLLENVAVDPSDYLVDHPVYHPSYHPVNHPSGGPVGEKLTTPVISPLLPIPTPTPTPDSLSPSETRASRKRHIPDDWAPTASHAAKARQLELNLEEQVEAFRDYDRSKGPVWKDFDAAFNNWLRNAAKWGNDTRSPNRTTDDATAQAMRFVERQQGGAA